jgi:hypothetical protein
MCAAEDNEDERKSSSGFDPETYKAKSTSNRSTGGTRTQMSHYAYSCVVVTGAPYDQLDVHTKANLLVQK